MNGDSFLMGKLVDSITMNVGKSDSALISEESNSERFSLNFLFEKGICFADPMLHHLPNV